MIDNMSNRKREYISNEITKLEQELSKLKSSFIRYVHTEEDLEEFMDSVIDYRLLLVIFYIDLKHWPKDMRRQINDQ